MGVGIVLVPRMLRYKKQNQPFRTTLQIEAAASCPDTADYPLRVCGVIAILSRPRADEFGMIRLALTVLDGNNNRSTSQHCSSAVIFLSGTPSNRYNSVSHLFAGEDNELTVLCGNVVKMGESSLIDSLTTAPPSPTTTNLFLPAFFIWKRRPCRGAGR